MGVPSHPQVFQVTHFYGTVNMAKVATQIKVAKENKNAMFCLFKVYYRFFQV